MSVQTVLAPVAKPAIFEYEKELYPCSEKSLFTNWFTKWHFHGQVWKYAFFI